MIIDKTTLASTVLDGGDEGEKEGEKTDDSPSEGTTPSAILLDGDGEKEEKSGDDTSSEEKSGDSPSEGGA